MYKYVSIFVAPRKRNNSLLNSSGITANVTGPALPAKSFLWGATGEQEWTPAITTGILKFMLFYTLHKRTLCHEVFETIFKSVSLPPYLAFLVILSNWLVFLYTLYIFYNFHLINVLLHSFSVLIVKIYITYINPFRNPILSLCVLTTRCF